MDYELIEKAKQVINSCFDDKHWLHTVGCALRTKSGKIFTGVNEVYYLINTLTTLFLITPMEILKIAVGISTKNNFAMRFLS